MSAIRATYRRAAEMALHKGIKFPAADPTMRKIRQIITEKVLEGGPTWSDDPMHIAEHCIDLFVLKMIFYENRIQKQ